MRRQGRYLREYGFTLVELMVTVSIAGILLGFGVPAMQEIFMTQRVKTAASDAHLSLLLARSEAIKRNQNIVIDTASNWENGWNVKVQADSTVLRTQDPFSGVKIECNTDADDAAETCPSTVTFTRTGRTSSFVEFRLFIDGNNKVFARCVTISLSGVPRVEVDNDRNAANGCS